MSTMISRVFCFLLCFVNIEDKRLDDVLKPKKSQATQMITCTENYQIQFQV